MLHTPAQPLRWIVVTALLGVLIGSPALPMSSARAAVSDSSLATAAASLAQSAETIEVDDPTLDSIAQIEISGKLLVVITEPDAAAETTAAAVSDSDAELRRYAVETADGDVVPVAGDFSDDVRTGDDFSGAVAVTSAVLDAVLAELAPTTASALAAAAGTAPIAESSDATQDVIDAIADSADSADSAGPLPVASASVVTAEVAAATTALSHELYVVVVNPTGTAPLTQSNATITSLAQSAMSFWSTASNGLIPAFTQTSTITHYSSDSPCSQDPFARWSEVLAQLGFSSSEAFLSGGIRHLVVLLPTGCNTDQGPGVGTVGSNLHDGGLVQVTLGQGVDTQTVIHEIGHNMSLGHSNLDVCDSDSVITGCTEYEYGDIYDVMGFGIKGYDSPLALNSRNQVALGFVASGSVPHYELAASDTSTTFTASLSTVVSGATPHILEAVDPATGEVYDIEYRRGDSGAFYSSGYSVLLGSTTVTVNPGVRLLRSTDDNGSSVITEPASEESTTSVSSIWVGENIGNASGTITVAVTSGTSTLAQVSVTIARAPSAVTQPVYRFWSQDDSAHFYTISAAERDLIIATYPTHAWQYEGVRYQAYTTQVAGTVPLYRFWSSEFSGHFFTISEGEKNSVIADYDDSTWKYEGIAYYVYPLDTSVPFTKVVARFWSPDNLHHFYTADAGERKSVIADYPDNVWTYEGARFRVPIG